MADATAPTGAKIIDGKIYAERLRAQVTEEVAALRAEHGLQPGLAVVLVGEDPASQIYVRSKGEHSLAAGMHSVTHRLPIDTSQDELLRLVADLNADPLACLEALIRTSFESLDSHASACEIYQNDHNYISRLPNYAALRRVSQATQRIWLDTLAAGVAAGEFRDDVDPTIFYRFLRDAIWMSIRWQRPGARRAEADLAASCIAVFVEGFSTARVRS